MRRNRHNPAYVAVALTCATAALPSIGIAAAKNVTDTEKAATAVALDADSCSAAFATVMASYLKPEIDKQFPGDTAAIAEFTRGVAHAFDIKNVDAPYYLGVRNGFAIIDRFESMQEMGFPITTEAFCKNLGDALKGSAMGFDTDSADAFLREAMIRMYPDAAPKTLTPESQQAYISDQKAREGVIETPSGLLFEVITEGEGAQPTLTDIVKVTYTGRLSDGTVFDSTERPIQFPVNRLVPGFTEGLQMMKTGGEYRIIIPPQIGYGDKGASGVIPPGAVLDFTVRLLDILPQQQATPENPLNNQ